jgi:hypothetical protein
LGETHVDRSFTVDLSEVNVNWSRGVFGPLRGQLTRGDFQKSGTPR